MGGHDVAVAVVLPHHLLEVVEVAAARVCLVAQHHAGPLAIAHGGGAAVGQQVDEYVRAVEEPKRGTLETLRRTILEVVPEAEQVISYGVPAFRVRGRTVAGFAAFKTHLSYLPFSGSVLAQLGEELEGYKMTKSSLHFPVDRPLPNALVQRLIDVRLTELARRSRV